MKIKTFLLFILYFSIFSKLSAQETSKNAVEEYYQHINAAEMHIVDEQYEKANDEYTKAFEPNGVQFAKDLNNAFYSAAYSKNSKLAKIYLDSLAFYGDSKEVIEKKIQKYKLAPIGFSSSFDSLQNIGRKAMDWNWIRKCDSFANVDQEIRKKVEPVSDREGALVDSINFFGFLAEIDKYGFPGFRKVGFFSLRHSDLLITNEFTFVLWHQRGARFNDSVENKLVQFVKRGWLLPYDYAVARYVKYDYYGFVPTDDATAQTIATYDKHRTAIYMDSLSDFKKKMHRKFSINGTNVDNLIPFVFHNAFVDYNYENR